MVLFGGGKETSAETIKKLEEDLQYLQEDYDAFADRVKIKIGAAMATKTEIEHTKNLIEAEIEGITRNLSILDGEESDSKNRYERLLKEQTASQKTAEVELKAAIAELMDYKRKLLERTEKFEKEKEKIQKKIAKVR